ncbi:hypothetical protein pb186bvf_000069 [Paramecium bursaria]
MDFEYSNRPLSGQPFKNRPESAKPQYGKPLPKVRPSSAVISKTQHVKKRHQEDEFIIQEKSVEEIFDYEKPGVEYQLSSNNSFKALFLQAPSSQIDKKLPKNIKKDKEKLYEEQIELKQIINTLKEENTRLKTKNQTLQKENVKLEKLLGNIDNQIQMGNTQHQPLQDHLLMNNLKKTLKEIKTQLNEKEGELLILKKHIKVTKIQEMEQELREYIQENLRLRTLLEQSLKNQSAYKVSKNLNNFEEKLFASMKIINSLEQEIEQLQGMYRLKDEELFNSQVKQEQFEMLKIRAEEQAQQLEQQLQETEQKLDQLQQELINIKNINNNLIIKATRTQNDDMRIRELETLYEEGRIEILEKSHTIEQLQIQIQDQKRLTQDNFNQFEKERKKLENDMEYYKTEYQMLDEKYKALLYSNAQEPLSVDDQQPSKTDRRPVKQQSLLSKNSLQSLQPIMSTQQNIQNIREDQKKNTLQPQQQQRPQSGMRRRRTVKLEDVRDLGLELNMRFRLKKLKFDQVIEEDLFDIEIKQKNCISVKDIAVRLSNSPFELKDVEKIYLLARFLVEDNTQDYVDYDEENNQQLSIVKSIFKQLIGKYKVFSQQEEGQLQDEIINQIVKYKKSIQSYLPTMNQQFLSRDQITKAFNYMGLQLSADAIDFFFLRLFDLQDQQDCKQFDYKLILEEWGKEDRFRNTKKLSQKG